MLPEDSIRTKTWVTEDGRYLTVREIDDAHLHNIRHMLLSGLPTGYDMTGGRELVLRNDKGLENLLDYTIEIDRDTYAASWIQIIDDELSRRKSV